MHALDVGLGAGPEHRRGLQPVAVGRDPQRRRLVPPSPVAHRLAIAQVEMAQLRIVHRVVHDAVAVRAQAGGQGVVVGEGQRRIAGRQPVGAGAGGGDRIQRRHAAAADHGGGQAVDRDQDDRGCGRRGGRWGGATGEQREQRQQRDAEGGGHASMIPARRGRPAAAAFDHRRIDAFADVHARQAPNPSANVPRHRPWAAASSLISPTDPALARQPVATLAGRSQGAAMR